MLTLLTNLGVATGVCKDVCKGMTSHNYHARYDSGQVYGMLRCRNRASRGLEQLLTCDLLSH